MRALSTFLLLAVMACGAQAQQMYRCGQVFQDRPCDPGVQEQRITPGGARAPSTNTSTSPSSPSAGAAPSVYATQCARVGQQAQGITWKREGGATMEKQISEAHGDQGTINLIMSVYARRGSAPEIRSQIEKECVVERERQANAAAALADLQRAANPAPLGAGTSAPTAAAAPAPGNASAPSQQVSTTRNGPDSRCSMWKSDREDVEARMRKGGTPVYMEQLQNERRSIEAKMSQARC